MVWGEKWYGREGQAKGKGRAGQKGPSNSWTVCLHPLRHCFQWTASLTFWRLWSDWSEHTWYKLLLLTEVVNDQVVPLQSEGFIEHCYLLLEYVVRAHLWPQRHELAFILPWQTPAVPFPNHKLILAWGSQAKPLYPGSFFLGSLGNCWVDGKGAVSQAAGQALPTVARNSDWPPPPRDPIPPPWPECHRNVRRETESKCSHDAPTWRG